MCHVWGWKPKGQESKTVYCFFKMKATQADVAEEEMKGRGKCCWGGWVGVGALEGGGRVRYNDSNRGI